MIHQWYQQGTRICPSLPVRLIMLSLNISRDQGKMRRCARNILKIQKSLWPRVSWEAWPRRGTLNNYVTGRTQGLVFKGRRSRLDSGRCRLKEIKRTRPIICRAEGPRNSVSCAHIFCGLITVRHWTQLHPTTLWHLQDIPDMGADYSKTCGVPMPVST